jgi:hypothetical protein
MTQGQKLKVLRKLLNAFAGMDSMENNVSVPTKGRNKRRRYRTKTRVPMYKSAVSGFPRTSTPCGSIPAPTMDQVRRIEQKYKIKLHVKQGLLYFRDGQIFNRNAAKARMQAIAGD